MPFFGPSLRGEPHRTGAAEGSAPPRTADDEILAAFESGEPGAGERLYERLLPVVDVTIARVVGGRESDHADLVQATFEQIVSTVMKQRYAGRCSLAGWAAAIACHVGFNALRSRRRERGVIDRRRDDRETPSLGAVDHAPAPPLEPQLSARDELTAVRMHLAQMAPERVTTLLLHAMGYDLADIAELTRTSVAAAQSRLSRARRELRERVDSERSPDPTSFAARWK